MLTVNKLISQARGLAPALLKRAATVQLDWDVRQKSRFDATDSSGRGLGVFLPRGTAVRGGDVLVAQDGSLIVVHAAPQPVLVVRPGAQHGLPFDLLRAAYHLGNRHVPLQLAADHLKLEPDHVLAGMLRRMGLIVAEANDAFEPEAGAYPPGGDAHDQASAHPHGVAQGDGRDGPGAPDAARSASPAHVHRPGCTHDDHDHDHDRDRDHDHAHDHGHKH